MTEEKFSEGGKAMKLALACFLENISYESFEKLPQEEQVAFARSNAGLSQEDLVAALHWIDQYHMKLADHLRAFRDSHRHA